MSVVMNRLIARHTFKRATSAGMHARCDRRYVHTPAVFDWQDPLSSNTLFTEEELAIQETAKSYCQERLLPRVLGIDHH